MGNGVLTLDDYRNQLRRDNLYIVTASNNLQGGQNVSIAFRSSTNNHIFLDQLEIYLMADQIDLYNSHSYRGEIILKEDVSVGTSGTPLSVIRKDRHTNPTGAVTSEWEWNGTYSDTVDTVDLEQSDALCTIFKRESYTIRPYLFEDDIYYQLIITNLNSQELDIITWMIRAEFYELTTDEYEGHPVFNR